MLWHVLILESLNYFMFVKKGKPLIFFMLFIFFTILDRAKQGNE